jgi:hypothetical protein
LQDELGMIADVEEPHPLIVIRRQHLCRERGPEAKETAAGAQASIRNTTCTRSSSMFLQTLRRLWGSVSGRREEPPPGGSPPKPFAG